MSVGELLPRRVRYGLKRVKSAAERCRFAGASSGDIFSAVYRGNAWGGRRGEFDSGVGSAPELSAPYVRFVTGLVRSHGVRSILDLGCGDFRVGSQLVTAGVTYTGLDVVPELIARNQARFGAPGVRFAVADVVRDDLPPADLVLIRQVLQHLSNDQVQAVLAKLVAYPLALVTEHLPHRDVTRFTPNRDKAPGPDTRLVRHSGVVPGLAPFDVVTAREAVTTPLPGRWVRNPEVLRSWLVAPALS